MSGPLRQIAPTVQQAAHSGHAWSLIEGAGGRSFVLDRAFRSWSSYLGAQDALFQELDLLPACGLHESGLPGDGAEAANDARPARIAELQNAL